MRNISFMLTTKQFLNGSKTVTRRAGWRFARTGDLLSAVKQSQGLGKGAKILRLGVIRLIDVRREPLRRMIDESEYGRIECTSEGFPTMTPEEFVEFFCRSHTGCKPETVITRIQFERRA